MEIREISQVGYWIRSYGSIDCGLDLMEDAWHTLEHVFSVNQLHLRKTQPSTRLYEGPRFKLDLLERHQVDLLVIERGHVRRPHGLAHKEERWEQLIGRVAVHQRPKIVIESWDATASLWSNGPLGQANRIRWDTLGYRTSARTINATKVGGAVRQKRLLVTRITQDTRNPPSLWMDTPPECESSSGSQYTERPMSNLLVPVGLVPRSAYRHTITAPGLDPDVSPMPTYPAWITTVKGTRRLFLSELARGLGVDKGTAEGLAERLTPKILEQTTSVYHWEYLSVGLVMTQAPTADGYDPTMNDGTPPYCSLATQTNVEDLNSKKPEFVWYPPDLTAGGVWYKRRLLNLIIAANNYEDSFDKLRQGIQMLDIHRGNYTATHPEPRELQILWWEFPKEHWDDLRDGSSMNFLSPPPAGLTMNGDMDDVQRSIAGEFVDELVNLRVLQKPPPERPTISNAPLFLLPKDGQPGQWRCIANLLTGGQNSVVGNDPVFLPRVSHILPQLYAGGYSAVVDASKFFYQFKTRTEERPYLGMIHPITHEVYEYCGLPMGAANSPALGSRYGLAFVRVLRSRFLEFQGHSTANCWWSGFSAADGYDPSQGYGQVFMRSNGRPAVRLWVFVDDFLIHGPDRESTMTALTLFLDTAVEVGLLCHPGKLTPPQQVVKYCGFLIDTRNIPKQIMPLAKRERAAAMIAHVLDSPEDKTFSRLALAVVAGVLESLVDATPTRLGHTYLRQTHSLVHPEGSGTGALPYYTSTPVPRLVRDELQWWATTLQVAYERQAYSPRSATLVPTWGDGSGTGTGGTLDLPDRPLQMWLGKWSPVVYKFSSNWKELSTLLLTMRTLQQYHTTTVQDTTIFYFTDNSTTYWIASSGSSRWAKLHSLITEIKLIELRLQCTLQVVHVPGLLMIEQGTDGLSRGVWVSPLHREVDQRMYTRAVFDPLPWCPSLVQHHLQTHCPQEKWTYQHWEGIWEPSQWLDKLTVWFPPPELARQVISAVLEAWVERPLTTSAFFFIPRVLLSQWRGLSRHIIEVAHIKPHLTPLACPPTLPIPILVLWLPRHTRVYPTLHRMDQPPSAHLTRWHREQAAYMRGLSSGAGES